VTLDDLKIAVEKRADEKFATVLTSILEAQFVQSSGCRKCLNLLQKYVRYKILESRCRRSESCSIEELNRIIAQAKSARDDFHMDECTCGLQLWRAQRWRDQQPLNYQIAFANYNTRGNRQCL